MHGLARVCIYTYASQYKPGKRKLVYFFLTGEGEPIRSIQNCKRWQGSPFKKSNFSPCLKSKAYR